MEEGTGGGGDRWQVGEGTGGGGGRWRRGQVEVSADTAGQQALPVMGNGCGGASPCPAHPGGLCWDQAIL